MRILDKSKIELTSLQAEVRVDVLIFMFVERGPLSPNSRFLKKKRGGYTPADITRMAAAELLAQEQQNTEQPSVQNQPDLSAHFTVEVTHNSFAMMPVEEFETHKEDEDFLQFAAIETYKSMFQMKQCMDNFIREINSKLAIQAPLVLPKLLQVR